MRATSGPGPAAPRQALPMAMPLIAYAAGRASAGSSGILQVDGYGVECGARSTR